MSETGARHMTPRRVFGIIAVILAVALLGLIVYLLLMLDGGPLRSIFGETRGNLRALVVIDGPGTGEKPEFDRPLGVAVSPGGDIYVADTGNNRICVFNRRGRFLFEFGGHGVAKPAPGVDATWDEGELNFPMGLDVDEQGNVYVADFRNDSISVFTAEGEFVRRFPDPYVPAGRGSSGQDGTGIAVTDVAVRDGKVYATDSYQVLVFTTQGELVTQFGKPGLGPGDLDRPNGIDVGEHGTIFVSDSNHNRVTAFTADGEPVWNVGEPITQVAGQAEYVFGLPRGITLTSEGTLLVADSFEFELVEIELDGTLGESYGDRGVEPAQFNFPNGIDEFEGRIVVADKENDRVQVLELVR